MSCQCKKYNLLHPVNNTGIVSTFLECDPKLNMFLNWHTVLQETLAFSHMDTSTFRAVLTMHVCSLWLSFLSVQSTEKSHTVPSLWFFLKTSCYNHRGYKRPLKWLTTPSAVSKTEKNCLRRQCLVAARHQGCPNQINAQNDAFEGTFVLPNLEESIDASFMLPSTSNILLNYEVSCWCYGNSVLCCCLARLSEMKVLTGTLMPSEGSWLVRQQSQQGSKSLASRFRHSQVLVPSFLQKVMPMVWETDETGRESAGSHSLPLPQER